MVNILRKHVFIHSEKASLPFFIKPFENKPSECLAYWWLYKKVLSHLLVYDLSMLRAFTLKNTQLRILSLLLWCVNLIKSLWPLLKPRAVFLQDPGPSFWNVIIKEVRVLIFLGLVGKWNLAVVGALLQIPNHPCCEDTRVCFSFRWTINSHRWPKISTPLHPAFNVSLIHFF